MPRKPRSATASALPQVGPGEPFSSSLPDREVRRLAQAEGEAGIYDPRTWGANRSPFVMWLLIAYAAVQRHLFGHELDRSRLGPSQRIEQLLPALPRLRATAIQAIDRWEHALGRVFTLEREAGPGRAAARPGWLAALVACSVVALALGELHVLAPSPCFQVLGLKDAPLVWFAPVVSEQLVGALASVVALIWLGHALGEDHGYNRNRYAAQPWYVQLAAASSGHRVHIAFLVALLLGLAVVRGMYLDARGTGTVLSTIGFLLLNVGLIGGVRYLSPPENRPFVLQLADAVKLADRAQRVVDTAMAVLEAQVAAINATVVEIEVVLSQYGHALDAVGADASRQIALSAVETRLAAPEPITEPLFDTPLPAPEECRLQQDLRAYLAGDPTVVVPFHRYARVELDDVRARYAELQARAAARWAPAPTIVPLRAAMPATSSSTNGECAGMSP